MAPMIPATQHIFWGELNSTENPHTPPNAVMSHSAVRSHRLISGVSKPCGSRLMHRATAQAASVATMTMAMKYVRRWIPDWMSILKMSRPPVINGNPGMTNRMAPM